MRKSFFTATSFTGMAGATTATMLLCNTMQSVSGWFHRGAAFGIAVLVTFGITFLIQKRPEGRLPGVIFMTFLNGCLVYFSAFGFQNTLIAEEKPSLLPPVMSAPIRTSEPGVPLEPIKRRIVEPERTFTTKW